METVCMQNKSIKLLVIFVVLFSLPGFSQTVEKSRHPKMDAYYPPKKVADTSKAVTAETKAVPETKAASGITTSPLVTAPPSVTTAPVEITAPTVTSTLVKAVTPAETTAPAEVIAPAVAVTPEETPTINAAPAPVPIQEKIQTKLVPTHPYIGTRLGSSSKLYDTYEKNKNGAGSVTTSSK